MNVDICIRYDIETKKAAVDCYYPTQKLTDVVAADVNFQELLKTLAARFASLADKLNAEELA